MVCNVGNPIVPAYLYQRRVLEDQSRLIGWVKSRQIGGSWTATLKTVLHALETGQDWNTMSRTQRQAAKLLRKAADHVRAIDRYVTGVLGLPSIVKDIGTLKIVLANNAELEALPCDPDTTTGDTCNWLIDEFDLFPSSHVVFAMIKPSIMHGKRMVVISSPRSRSGKFFDLYDKYKRGGSGWSFHRTTIEDAIADGFHPTDEHGNKISFKEFKHQEVHDMGLDMFLQEYMCLFSDKLTAFIPHALVLDCVSAKLRLSNTPELLAALGRKVYVGMDIGRVRDLSVIWIVSKTGDVYTTEAIHVMDGAPFRFQMQAMKAILDTGCVAGAMIDQNGIGMQMAEDLAADYPSVVVPFVITNASKNEVATRIKNAMQSQAFWMPDDEDCVDDFASIQKNVTVAGNVQIAAPRTHGAGGHGDRFWAAALAVHAAATIEPFELTMAC